MLSSPEIKAEVKIIFQTVEDLHIACPKHFGIGITGDYPTPGGNRVVNRAFMNFYEGKMLEHTSKFPYLVFNRFSKLFV
jgi:amidophosphoribosyltransferase